MKSAYDAGVTLEEKTTYFKEIQPYHPRNHAEFNKRKQIFNNAEQAHKREVYPLAKLIPTVTVWYEFPEVKMRLYKYNHYQLEIVKM